MSYIEQDKTDPWTLASDEYDRITNPYPKSDFRYTMTFDEQEEAIRNLKTEDIRKFYSDFYNGTNATVAVVGAFDEAAVLSELTVLLKDWSSPVRYERAVGKFFDVASVTKTIAAKDKKSAAMAAGCNLPLQDNDPDYPALVIGNYMLGGGFLNSRMAARLRQKEGICYSVGTYVEADPIDKCGGFGSYAMYNPQNSDKLMAAYKEELDKLKKGGFTESELKDAVTGYLQSQNVSRSKDNILANNLSGKLYLGRSMKWDDKNEKTIAALKASDVNAAMRKWINPEKIIYVQAGEFEGK